MECDCHQAYVQGTVRSFKPEVQDYIEQRFKEIAKAIRATVQCRYRSYIY